MRINQIGSLYKKEKGIIRIKNYICSVDRAFELAKLLDCKDDDLLEQRSIRRSFHHVTEKLGLPRIRFHDLRHTYATLLVQQNVKSTSEQLSHSDIDANSNTYSHVLHDMQRTISEKLNNIFKEM